MQAVLVMFRPDGQRRSFSIVRDVTVVGRREDCDLRIPLADVSRKHCRFIKDEGTLRMEDLGSSNGTYHNGRRVQEAALQPGDTVQIGPVAFVFQLNGSPPDEAIQPMMNVAGSAMVGDGGAPTLREEGGAGKTPLPPPLGAPGQEEVIPLGADDEIAPTGLHAQTPGPPPPPPRSDDSFQIELDLEEK